MTPHLRIFECPGRAFYCAVPHANPCHLSSRVNMPPHMLRRLFFIRLQKADADQLREVIHRGADPNWKSNQGTPALIWLVRGFCVESAAVKALLDNGADPRATDTAGLTILDYARRRLSKYEGRPRTPPRRSSSLSPGGELILPNWEWDSLEKDRDENPEFVEDYLEERRKVAGRVFDTRGNLERIVSMLEKHLSADRPPSP